MSETGIMRDIMIALSQAGARVFRNNVGVARFRDDKTGEPRFVRYGLCEGSSDIIGLVPVTITPEMVGRKVAVFAAIEVKDGRGRASTDQLSFVEMVGARGGIAGVARSVEDAMALIRNYFR